MRGTSPALAVSEVEGHPFRDATHVDSDDDAEESGVDARNDCSQPLFAGTPVPRNRLSTMMSSKTERMLSLLSYAKSFAMLSRRKVLFVKGFLRWT